MNNFSSIIIAVLSKKLHRDDEIAGALAGLILFLVCGGAVALLARFLSKKERFEDGIFGKSFPATDSFATCKLAPGRSVSLFFAFPMVLFFALSASQVITLIWMAVTYQHA